MGDRGAQRPAPAGNDPESSSQRRWWPWLLAVAVVGCVLMALLFGAPYAKHQPSISKSPADQEQARLEREEAWDEPERLRDRHEREDRRRAWEAANPGKLADRPDFRTFIGRMPQGVRDLVPMRHGLLAGDGRWLNDRDLIYQRLGQGLPQLEEASGPQAARYAAGKLILWSNGVVTGPPLQCNNLPGHGYDYARHQYTYSEEAPGGSCPQGHPFAPPLVIRDAIAVASTAQSDFSLILRRDGTVWGQGGNAFGQLGNDAPSLSGVDRPVDGLKNVVAIAAGVRHGLALDRDGRVWQWGQDDLPYYFYEEEFKFRRGLDPKMRHEGYNPVARPVEGLPDVVKIAAAGTTSFAIDAQGEVWAWGGAGGGKQCGLIPAHPDDLVLKRPIKHEFRANPVVVGQPYRIPGLSEMVDIQAEASHVLTLRADGTVWGWGCNRNWLLGPPETVAYRNCSQPHDFKHAECAADQSVSGPHWIDRPHKLRGIDQVKQILTAPGYSAVLKEDDSLWYIGNGCGLCTHWNLPLHYTYALKVKSAPQGRRLLEFEQLTFGDYPRNTEWGIYWVDDSAGRVNGIAPWDPGYPQTALDAQRAVTVFDKVVEDGTKVRFEAESGRMFALYIISGGTLEQWRESNPENRENGQPLAYFSFPMANSDQLDPTRHSRIPARHEWRVSSYVLVKWFGLAPDNPSSSGSNIGQTVRIRGARGLEYDDLPNHRE